MIITSMIIPDCLNPVKKSVLKSIPDVVYFQFSTLGLILALSYTMTGIRGKRTRRAKRIINVRTKAHRSKRHAEEKILRHLSKDNELSRTYLAPRCLERKSTKAAYSVLGMQCSVMTRQDLSHARQKTAQVVNDEMSDVSLATKGVKREASEDNIHLDFECEQRKAKLPHFSSGMCAWLAELIKIHGQDYRAMFYDLKHNPYQLTENKLRKYCTAYEKLREASADHFSHESNDIS